MPGGALLARAVSHMRLGPAIGALLVCPLGACFYTDGVNARPTADIRENAQIVYAGTPLTFTSKSTDPDGESLRLTWRALECLDDTLTDCDVFAEQDGNQEQFSFTYPWTKHGGLVTLRATDSHGAYHDTTRTLTPVNRAPTVLAHVQAQSTDNSYIVGRTLHIVAQVTEPDGAADVITWEWQVFPPTATFERISDTEYTFRADAPGMWQVVVTASDDDPRMPLSGMYPLPILITPDQGPCVTSTSPPPAGAETPVLVDRAAGPRVFQVLRVEDDLDPYPYELGTADGEMQSSTFRWFVGTSEASLVPVPGADLAEYAFHPEAYAPGQDVVVRVEVKDRVHDFPACPVDAATCSIGAAECTQRITWKVEIR